MSHRNRNEQIWVIVHTRIQFQQGETTCLFLDHNIRIDFSSIVTLANKTIDISVIVILGIVLTLSNNDVVNNRILAHA